VLPGQGPRGDRYFSERPKEREGKDLTLIEAEALEAMAAETGIEISAAEARRNVLTRGIGLNDLVGRRFRVGEVECEGVMLNEPCAHLQSLTKPGVLKGLVRRGGLRANVLRGGTIAVGDSVEPLPE
jgi:MOSC domain-containing protein YiiM